jgi:hypothetical protein
MACLPGCLPGETKCPDGNCCPAGRHCGSGGHCECDQPLCGGFCCKVGDFCCGTSREAGYCCGAQQANKENKALCGEGAETLNNDSLLIGLGGTGLSFLGGKVAGKVAAAIASLESAAYKYTANALSHCKADPPDSNYRHIVKPASYKLPAIQAGEGVNAVAADAVNRMLANQVRAPSLVEAWIVSIERAQGAGIAGNKQWVTRQVKAAAKFANQAADAYALDVSLRRGARSALEASGISEVTLTVTEVMQAQQEIASNGLAPELVASMRAVHISQSDIDALKAAILAAPPMQFAQPVLLAPLTNPNVLRDSSSMAATLREYAKRARQNPIARTAAI